MTQIKNWINLLFGLELMNFLYANKTQYIIFKAKNKKISHNTEIQLTSR